MEIIIKTKQQSNPLFSFLDMHDALYPYYAHLKTLLANGSYVPTTTESQEKTDSTVEATNTERGDDNKPEDQVVSSATQSVVETVDSDSKSVSDEDSDSEDDGYLHPLLMQTLTSRSKSSTPTPTVSVTTKEATPPPSFDVPTLSAVNFRARSMVVNAAPVLRQKPVDSPPPDPLVTSAASVTTSQDGNTHNRCVL